MSEQEQGRSVDGAVQGSPCEGCRDGDGQLALPLSLTREGVVGELRGLGLIAEADIIEHMYDGWDRGAGR